MPEIIIYHNGECSKSKGALEILQQRNIPHDVRWYLTEPLSRIELKALLEKLQMPASALVRRSEPLYTEVCEGRNFTEEEWLDLLEQHPILIERPIVETSDRAIIARPPERVLELL